MQLQPVRHASLNYRFFRIMLLTIPLVLHECPFCHKLLAAELLSKEEVDAHDRKIFGPAPPTIVNPASPFRPVRTIPLREVSPPDIEPTGMTEESVTYKLVYKCKYCGKEWSKLSKKEYDIPEHETD